MAMNNEIKSEAHVIYDKDAIAIVTEVQRMAIMQALDFSLMNAVRDRIADKIVERFMEEHGSELVSSLKLADVKELALIKSANRLNSIFSKMVIDEK